MVTRDTQYLTIDIFLDVAAKKKFHFVSLVWYLFNVMSGCEYLVSDCDGNALTTGEVILTETPPL